MYTPSIRTPIVSIIASVLCTASNMLSCNALSASEGTQYLYGGPYLGGAGSGYHGGGAGTDAGGYTGGAGGGAGYSNPTYVPRPS